MWHRAVSIIAGMSAPYSDGLHTATQVREIDRAAIDLHGIAGYTLMTRAASSALAVLERHWPTARRLVVVCGGGNNAGDGYVLARLARQRRFDVVVVRLVDPTRLGGAARRAGEDFAADGGVAVAWDDSLLEDADLVVDAILGTGLTRPVAEPMASCIAAINRAGVPVLALDVPSGLDADTGCVLGIAIHADRTVTFVGRKIGLHLDRGPDCSGAIDFEALAIPEAIAAGVDAVANLIGPSWVTHALPPRHRTAHKGDFGHVLIVAGGPGMPGAARLCGEGALRVGAGRVTVACAEANVAAVVSSRPELMCVGVDDVRHLDALLERIDVVAIGPGLGTDTWARSLFERCTATDKPLVVDADGLNLLAESPRRRSDWVLTPHPGEAGRLLGCSGGAIQTDRMRAALALHERYSATVVLKGANTLVATAGERPFICDRGNPAMAAPGMGDVLTGIVAGIAAQSRDLVSASLAGVYVHACAGDLAAARIGPRGVLAGDVASEVPACLRQIA
jgi:NAD(P)H-hydrate epimerase